MALLRRELNRRVMILACRYIVRPSLLNVHLQATIGFSLAECKMLLGDKGGSDDDLGPKRSGRQKVMAYHWLGLGFDARCQGCKVVPGGSCGAILKLETLSFASKQN